MTVANRHGGDVRWGRNLMAATAVGIGLILGWPTTALADYTPNATAITAASGCSVPGGSLTVNGTNFEPNESVTLSLNGTTIGVTTTNQMSSFSTVATIPVRTTPGTSYTIIATGASGDSASTAVMVAITCAVSSGLALVGGANSDLAFTGADIAALSSVGAIALALGGVLILSARRRRATGG